MIENFGNLKCHLTLRSSKRQAGVGIAKFKPRLLVSLNGKSLPRQRGFRLTGVREVGEMMPGRIVMVEVSGDPHTDS